MPPPSLLTTTQGHRELQTSRGHERIEVVDEGDVADHRDDAGRRPPRPRPGPWRRSPSMPLAPRLPRQRTAAGPVPRNASMSLTGMLLPASRMAPSGSAVPSCSKTWPSKGSSSEASQAPRRLGSGVIGRAPATQPGLVPGPLSDRPCQLPCQRRGEPDRLRCHHRGRQQGGLGPAAIVHDDLWRAAVPEPLQQRPRGGRAAEAQDQVRPVAVAPGRRRHDGGCPRDDV